MNCESGFTKAKCKLLFTVTSRRNINTPKNPRHIYPPFHHSRSLMLTCFLLLGMSCNKMGQYSCLRCKVGAFPSRVSLLKLLLLVLGIPVGIARMFFLGINKQL